MLCKEQKGTQKAPKGIRKHPKALLGTMIVPKIILKTCNIGLQKGVRYVDTKTNRHTKAKKGISRFKILIKITNELPSSQVALTSTTPCLIGYWHNWIARYILFFANLDWALFCANQLTMKWRNNKSKPNQNIDILHKFWPESTFSRFDITPSIKSCYSLAF